MRCPSLALFVMVACARGAPLRLSGVFGSHATLQRDVPWALWGWAAPSARVSTAFMGAVYHTTSGADGAWRQPLPAAPANFTPSTIEVAADSGERVRLTDVLFGDVFVCGGQSNMNHPVSYNENATAEVRARARAPALRRRPDPPSPAFNSTPRPCTTPSFESCRRRRPRRRRH